MNLPTHTHTHTTHHPRTHSRHNTPHTHHTHTHRLESIAADAELQEKSLSELESLADTLHQACEEAEAEHRSRSVMCKSCDIHMYIVVCIFRVLESAL